MSDAPEEVYRALAYSRTAKRAVYKFYATLEHAQREVASGTPIHRYKLQPAGRPVICNER